MAFARRVLLCIATHVQIKILRVRGADVSVKPGAQAPGIRSGKAKKACEAGGSRIFLN
jgi:hypothetical protein